MIELRALAWAIPGALLLVACGGAESPADNTATERRAAVKTVTAKLPPAQAPAELPQENRSLEPPPPAQPLAQQTAQPATQPPAEPRSLGGSRYTSLEPASCQLLEASTEQGSVPRRRCAGASGYALETREVDGRQEIALIAPDGSRSELDLTNAIGNGASASLGKVAEWRAPAPGKPRALIVRVNVDAGTEARYPRNSNLAGVRLDAEPCVVSVVPRGPGQNEKARAIADGKLPECAKD